MSEPGDRLIGGRYRLTERIGSGGMGTVWRAVDEVVEREVAVKEPLLPGDPDDPGHQRASHRLYREARAAARVDHPSAVAIHDVVVDDGLPWIVMEFIRGESLQAALRRGPLPPAEAARIGLAVVGALRAAHSAGIVHRDVKPANVLLGPHGRTVLTDFGIAHIQGEESLTVSGEFVGSLEFIAPERMAGRSAGPSSDLWSLGVLLYTAVEGRSPFRRTTPESTIAAILNEGAPEPERAGALGPLLVRLLAKEPEERPEGAEVAAALEAVAEGWPVPEGRPVLAEPQDIAVLREFGDDSRTVRLAAPPPEEPAPSEETAAVLTPRSKRRQLLVAVLLFFALVATGGIWFAVRPGAQGSASTSGWSAHREQGMDAVLYLPRSYKWMQQLGEADDDPRATIYSNGAAIQVRLDEWNKAPRSLMAEAKSPAYAWAGHESSPAQYTRTSFQGHEAVLADTTYDPHGKKPTRVMRLIIRTDDSRMYELTVNMPKGTPDEKRGTAVFKGARDRLVIENT